MFLTLPLHLNAQQQRDNISTVDGDRVFTHGETLERVSRLAGGLRAHGVGSEERVAILSYNSDRLVEAIAAVAWADAVFVPLNWRWSVPELAFGLADCGAVALFVDEAFAPLVSDLLASCPDIRVIVAMDESPLEDLRPVTVLQHDALIDASEAIEDAYRRGDALAGIFYTGGTTGRSKGVMLSHRNFTISQLGVARLFFSARSPMLYAAPLFHVAALTSWVSQMILGGSNIFLRSFDVTQLLDAIQEYRIVNLPLVPTMLQMIVDHPSFDEYDLTSLTDVGYGGSAMSDGALARVREKLPAVRLRHGYGLTETASVVAFLSDTDHDYPRVRRSVGQVSPHGLVRIVDADGQEVPINGVGEICVLGDHVMLGYWNRPEETEAALRDGWLHTGDVGRLDEEGYLYIVDRIKDMIVSGAENVYSSEVENAISTHPAVISCAVIGVADPTWGERVHAVITLRPGTDLTLKELRAHCKGLIAGYKCPRSLEVVEALPMTPAGKVNKVDLRTQSTATVDAR